MEHYPAEPEMWNDLLQESELSEDMKKWIWYDSFFVYEVQRLERRSAAAGPRLRDVSSS